MKPTLRYFVIAAAAATLGAAAGAAVAIQATYRPTAAEVEAYLLGHEHGATDRHRRRNHQ